MYFAEFFPAISIRDVGFRYEERPFAAVRENFSVDWRSESALKKHRFAAAC